jgi:hypothetical protein
LTLSGIYCSSTHPSFIKLYNIHPLSYWKYTPSIFFFSLFKFILYDLYIENPVNSSIFFITSSYDNLLLFFSSIIISCFPRGISIIFWSFTLFFPWWFSLLLLSFTFFFPWGFSLLFWSFTLIFSLFFEILFISSMISFLSIFFDIFLLLIVRTLFPLFSLFSEPSIFFSSVFWEFFFFYYFLFLSHSLLNFHF